MIHGRGPSQHRRARKASPATKLVAFAAVAPVFAALIIESPVPAGTRALITLVWVLSLLPLYAYVAAVPGRRRPLPFLPAIGVVFGLYYALPLTLGAVDNYYRAPVDPSVDYELPVQIVFFGWIALLTGYLAVSAVLKEKPATTELAWRPGYIAGWALLLLSLGILVTLAKASLGFSIISRGTFQFITSLQWLGGGLLTILIRRGEISVPLKLTALATMAISAAIMLASGSIAPVAMFIGIVGFGFWIGKPVLPIRWAVVAMVVGLVAVSFRGVAIDFRQTAWFRADELTAQERIALIVGLLGARIEEDGVAGTVAHGIAATAGRSANLDLLANVVRRTPSEVPYWNGTTYLSLVGSFVPRFIWPDKPPKVLGQAFGHRYGFIYWTNRSTSINLPILVEFFVNFSVIGVVMGMLLVGMIYRFLDSAVNRPGQTPLLSMIGGVLLLPLLLIESDFSLVFGGIPLNAGALWFVWMVLSRDSRKYATAKARPAGPAVTPRPAVQIAGANRGHTGLLGR